MKVGKDFYITNFGLDDINRNFNGAISLSENKNDLYCNKITISYEVDREITIKESDIDRVFSDKRIGFTSSDVELIKMKLFGDK